MQSITGLNQPNYSYPNNIHFLQKSSEGNLEGRKVSFSQSQPTKAQQSNNIQNEVPDHFLYSTCLAITGAALVIAVVPSIILSITHGH
jgi:hypothetical protein